MYILREFRKYHGLTRMVIQNLIQGERQIAYFRLCLIPVVLIHTFIVVYTNNRKRSMNPTYFGG